MAKNESKYNCRLPKFTRKECLSALEAKQQAGWGITAFEIPKAWQYTQGENVTIAVLDSGCDLDHPDLVNNLLEGKNFINPNASPEDDNGHGTHVTGILVAENNDIGMIGVCPKSKVVPIKVLDSKGNGNMKNVAEGINWAISQKVDIIQMSLGTQFRVQQVRKAIVRAAEMGIVTFCAAGNAGKTKEIFYPANYPEVISVGAIDKNFDRASFSNTGENLDFMAPGVDVFSTYPDNWYATHQGTSMACPFLVGIAALLKSYEKQGKTDFKLNSPNDYREVLRKYTIPLSDVKFKDSKFYGGYGIVDPRKFSHPN